MACGRRAWRCWTSSPGPAPRPESSSGGEELAKRALAARREIHDAGGAAALRPPARIKLLEQARADEPGEVVTPLAPVEAGAAKRAAARPPRGWVCASAPAT